MDIKDKIQEWHDSHVDRACSREEILQANQELELVFHVIDTLTDMKVKEA